MQITLVQKPQSDLVVSHARNMIIIDLRKSCNPFGSYTAASRRVLSYQDSVIPGARLSTIAIALPSRPE
jgi:hypothetical protein